MWLNAFLVKRGISSTHSPLDLIVQWKLDFKGHCWVEPGTYCEVHDEPSPSNCMIPRTHPGIALGPTRNMQGSVKFYCLTTGRVLKQRSFTPLAMPDRVIKRVNEIGAREKRAATFGSSIVGRSHLSGLMRCPKTIRNFRDCSKSRRRTRTSRLSFQECL